MEDGCANCGRLDGPRQNQVGVTVCEDCAWALGGNVFGWLEARAEQAESLCGDLRRERDDQCDANAVLREANKNLLAEMRAANERAEQAERERDEARGFAVYAEADLYVGEWTGYFRACSPAGLLGQDGSWDGRTPAKRFATAVEAEKAGRAVPWWEVKA